MDIERILYFSKIQLDISEKTQVLKTIHDAHRLEMNYHREAMNRTMQWITNLYIAITGGIIVIGSTNLKTYGQLGKLLIIFSVIIIAIFAIQQILHSADAINSNAKIVVKADVLMKLFDNNYFGTGESLYPKHWLAWGSQKGAGYYEWFNIFIISLLSLAVSLFIVIA